MPNIIVKDGQGTEKYLKASGSGTDLDPFVPNQDVTLQDQTTRPIDLYFTNIQGVPTTLASPAVKDSRTVTVTSAVGFTIGDYLGIFSGGNYYLGDITGVSGTTITVDSPLDFAFPAGSTTAVFDRDLALADGSVTPVIYGVEVGPAGTVSVDITRLMFTIRTATTPLFEEFGDLPTLTNGIVLRKVYANGDIENLFNIKKNSDLKTLAFDFSTYGTAGGGPFSEIEGFSVRLSFGGQSKHGVAIRLSPGDSLECVVQDNLTGLNEFVIMAQGHVVD